LGFFSACNKEKKSLRQIDGDWEITSYQEIVFDGTTAFFNLNSGSASFKSTKGSKEGTIDINWNATNTTDTSSFNLKGTFEQFTARELFLKSSLDSTKCIISRQLKKDMTLEFILNTNRKSIVQLKKR
jgi:hypothetical protein